MAIQAERSDVLLRIGESNPESHVFNSEGFITSGLNTNKRQRDDDGRQGKKKKRKRRKHRLNEPGSSRPLYGVGKVHVPNNDEEVHNPHNLDYEQELVIDRGETRTAGKGHVRDPSNGAQTPPLPRSWIWADTE